MASSLSIAGIDAGYGAVRVLEDVSLRVAPGETVVLLGTNGNGKSILMKCVMGILPPITGSIVAEIDGETSSAARRPENWRQADFRGTVHQPIAGKRHIDRDRASPSGRPPVYPKPLSSGEPIPIQ